MAYLEEMALAQAPGPVNVIGISNIAPAIMAFGTTEQAERFLRPMLYGHEIWSQGMSEPDAGSDLASLRTTAVPRGDVLVVNGQKTWNSLGRHADWCQLYVRTDPGAPKHRGISCLLVDMKSPGIEVRPVRTIAGELTFSELFFDDVEVPASAMLGPLNEGWRVAKTTLSHERAGVARLHLSLSHKFEHLLADVHARGVPIEPVYRDRLAALYSADLLHAVDDDPRARGGRQRSAAVAQHGQHRKVALGPGRAGARRSRGRRSRPGFAARLVGRLARRCQAVLYRGRHDRDQQIDRGGAGPRASPVSAGRPGAFDDEPGVVLTTGSRSTSIERPAQRR